MRVGVIGLGSAGLPLACAMADRGLNVVGIDINQDRVNKINNKINPIPQEIEIDQILKNTIAKNFFVTTNIKEYSESINSYIIIVPLFINSEKKPDFKYIDLAIQNICQVLKKGDTVVLETTVPPTTTITRIKEGLEKSGLIAGIDFHLGYSPERIMTGYSVSRYQKFPKIISSINEEGLSKVREIYEGFCDNILEASNTTTAEFIKISEGVYRDINISIANELYKVSEKLGINYYEVREKAAHKFCNLLEPSVGVGGHCIPVYPWFLINNFDVPLTKTSRLLNDGMAKYFTEIVLKMNAKSVLIIGLAYREGVKESNYSGSKLLINELKKNNLKVYGLDPNYNAKETFDEYDIEYSDDFDQVDVIIVANKLTEYLQKLQEYSNKVIDVKGLLKNNQLQEDYS